MADVGLPEGIVVPEKEIEERRRLVVDVCVQLDRKDNEENFRQSVVNMFGAFGLKQTTDPELLKYDNDRLNEWYKWRHETPQFPSDIQLHGQPDPNNPDWVHYANINIHRAIIAGKEVPVSIVSAGACSSLQYDTFRDNAGWRANLTGDFYRSFEAEIGVAVNTYTTEHGKAWVKDIRRKEENHIFAVAGGKYYRVPVNNWSIALASRIT